jgi:hypothetical protein
LPPQAANRGDREIWALGLFSKLTRPRLPACCRLLSPAPSALLLPSRVMLDAFSPHVCRPGPRAGCWYFPRPATTRRYLPRRGAGKPLGLPKRARACVLCFYLFPTAPGPDPIPSHTCPPAAATAGCISRGTPQKMTDFDVVGWFPSGPKKYRG